MTHAEKWISDYRLIPVVQLEKLDDALPLAAALKAGGLPIAEVTLRTECALEAIHAISGIEEFIVGAGTVLNRDQAEAVISRGAQFIVSPGFDRQLVQYCQEKSVPIIPGVATATEVQAASNQGVRIAKFFPAAAAGGVPMLKSLAGPFQEMKFVPTGGISLDNLEEYLSLACVDAVGGSWMVKPDLYRDGDFSKVTQRTAAAVKISRGISE